MENGACFVVKAVSGKVLARVSSLAIAKSRLAPGMTVWYRFPLTRTLTDQVTHHKDKVSRVHGKVQSARVGGQHSSVLTHTVETGRFRENRVW